METLYRKSGAGGTDARRGHLEQRDMTDAGGLRTRRQAVGRETILYNKAKLIPVWR